MLKPDDKQGIFFDADYTPVEILATILLGYIGLENNFIKIQEEIKL